MNDNHPPAPDRRPRGGAPHRPGADTASVRSLELEMTRLHALCEGMIAHPARRGFRDAFMDTVLVLKVRAEETGYDMLGVFADDIYRYLSADVPLTPMRLAAVAHYIHAMKQLVAYQISGPGNDDVRDHLEALRRRAEMSAA